MQQTIEYQVRRHDEHSTLLDFLARKLSVSRKTAKAILDQRHVTVNDTRVWMARHALMTGDRVTVLKAAADAAGSTRPRAVPILHRDAHYLVAAKPAGVLSCGPRSLETQLRQQTGIPALRAAHRLDRDTSGCLLFACTPEAFERIVAAFRAKTVVKVYHAIVQDPMKRGEHRISKPIGGQTAVSNVRVLDVSGKATHVAVGIETGRTHQIRIHLASVRHPVLGDRQYAAGGDRDGRKADAAIPRQMLHAYSLRFTHPYTDTMIRATAPLPPDFKACLKALKLT